MIGSTGMAVGETENYSDCSEKDLRQDRQDAKDAKKRKDGIKFLALLARRLSIRPLTGIMMSELHLLSPKGFRASAVYAGIKTKQTPDVGLLVCDTLATAAAVLAAPFGNTSTVYVAAGTVR